MDRPPEGRDALREWHDFFLAESHVLREFPELLAQQAANQPEGSPIASPARRFLEGAGGTCRPWLRWINRPARSALHLTFLGHEEEITSLVFARDGRRLVSAAADGSVRAWDFRTGRPLFAWRSGAGPGGATAVARRAFFSGGEDGAVRAWSLENGELLETIPMMEGPVTDLALSPDGRRLGVSDGSSARLFHLALMTASPALEGGAPLAFSPGGRFLRHGPSLFDLDRDRDACIGSGRAAFSPDGSFMASGSEGTIRLTDLGTGLVAGLFIGHTHWIGALAFSPDGRRLVSTGKHGEIMIWDTGPAAASGTTEYVPWVEGASAEEMKGYEVMTFAPRLEVEGHAGTISALEMLPDGRRFLTVSASSARGPMMSGADIGIKLWALEDGRFLGGIRGHGDRITALALSPDGRTLATGDGRGIIRAWDIDGIEGEADADTRTGSVTAIEISADGARVRAETTRGALVLDAGTGRVVEKAAWSGRVDEPARDRELGGGEWIAAYAGTRRMIEVRESGTGRVAARFPLAEDIDRLDARGSLVAAGGAGMGNVYLLEFRRSADRDAGLP